MNHLLLFVFIASLFVLSVYGDWTVASIKPGERVRAYRAAGWPVNNPRVGSLIGVNAEKDANGGEADASVFVLNTLGQVGVGYGYFSASYQVPDAEDNDGTSLGDFTASAFATGVRFHRLFEYVDTNGIDGYQLNDTIINVGYDLNSIFVSWKPWDISSENISADATLWTVVASTTDDVFTVKLYFTTHPIVNDDGVRINSDSTKMDIEIKYYNNPKNVLQFGVTFGCTDPLVFPNSKLGILASTGAVGGTFNYEAKSTGSTGSSNSGSQVTYSYNSGAYVGFWSWQPTALITVDGASAAGDIAASFQFDSSVDGNATADIVAGWVSSVMVFSPEGTRPSDIYWDPELGSQNAYESGSSSSSASSLSFSSLFVIALFTLLLSLF